MIVEQEKLEEALASDSAAQLDKALAARLRKELGRAVTLAESRKLAGEALGRSLPEARQQQLDAWRDARRRALERIESQYEEVVAEYDRLVLARAEANRKGAEPPSEDSMAAAREGMDHYSEAYAEERDRLGDSPQQAGHFSRRLMDEVVEYAHVVERRKSQGEGQ